MISIVAKSQAVVYVTYTDKGGHDKKVWSIGDSICIFEDVWNKYLA